MLSELRHGFIANVYVMSVANLLTPVCLLQNGHRFFENCRFDVETIRVAVIQQFMLPNELLHI